MVKERFQNILEKLCQAPRIKAAVLTDLEGCLVSQVLPSSCDKETLGTVICSTLAMTEDTIRDLGREEVKRICIKGKNGFIILHPINEITVLMVLASLDTDLKNLLLDIETSAKSIAQVI